MKKTFNVSADCKPNIHYMVDISPKLKEIRTMIEQGQYFTINRARQYGKSTTLKELSKFLEKDFMVISLDFQLLSYADYENENTFTAAFVHEILIRVCKGKAIEEDIIRQLKDFNSTNPANKRLATMFQLLSNWCEQSPKPIVLIIDEVDSAANNQVFLDFLAQLRGYYMNRDIISTFQSVILAGVYDIKTMKQKINQNTEHKTNSPWNIAANFLVDMSFSAKEIAGMLAQYESDHSTGMDIKAISELIYDYTSGYPYLVSHICKLVDERISETTAFPDKTCAWTKEGILEAISLLLSESNTLFESLFHKLEDYPELNGTIEHLLFTGKAISYTIGIRSIEIALMFGFLKKSNKLIVIANRIFEILLYDYFILSPTMIQNKLYDAALYEKNHFIHNGHLNMKRILEKFVVHFDSLCGDQRQNFLEEDGRRYFLLYLRPIINGVGNYYIEARTRNLERMDVVVDYNGEQFVIELKIWHGNEYNTRDEKQLSDYLDYYHLTKGYMISFNFNKKKEIGVKEITFGCKVLVEAVV